MFTVRVVTAKDNTSPVHMRDTDFEFKRDALAFMRDLYRGNPRATFNKATLRKFDKLYVIVAPAK